MAQKLSSRVKYNAIYYLGQNEIRTANPSFLENQGWSSAKAKTRLFSIFDRGGGGGKDSIFSIYFVQDCSLDATFMLLLDATVGVLFKKSPFQSTLFGTF